MKWCGASVKSNLGSEKQARTYNNFPSLEWCLTIKNHLLINDENVSECEKSKWKTPHSETTSVDDWCVVEYEIDPFWRKNGRKSNIISRKEISLESDTDDVEITINGSVETISVNPNDVILVRCELPSSPETINQLKLQLSQVFNNNRVLLVDNNYKMKITAEDRECLKNQL